MEIEYLEKACGIYTSLSLVWYLQIYEHGILQLTVVDWNPLIVRKISEKHAYEGRLLWRKLLKNINYQGLHCTSVMTLVAMKGFSVQNWGRISVRIIIFESLTNHRRNQIMWLTVVELEISCHKFFARVYERCFFSSQILLSVL